MTENMYLIQHPKGTDGRYTLKIYVNGEPLDFSQYDPMYSSVTLYVQELGGNSIAYFPLTQSTFPVATDGEVTFFISDTAMYGVNCAEYLYYIGAKLIPKTDSATTFDGEQLLGSGRFWLHAPNDRIVSVYTPDRPDPIPDDVPEDDPYAPPPPPPPPPDQTIRGIVVDEDGLALSGATVTCTYNNTVVTTGTTGVWQFIVPYNWAGTITVSKPGYTFAISTLAFSKVKTSISDQVFVGVIDVPPDLPPETTYYKVSGETLMGETDLVGIQIEFWNGVTKNVVYTDTSAYYSIRLPEGWTGTVTPVSTDYTFTPTSYSINDLSADTPGLDFEGEVAASGANHTPTAAPISASTVKNTSASITLIGYDADDDPLTYTIVDSPSHGALTGTAPNVVYTPATDYTGADSFTYKCNDGTVDSNTATVSITVTAEPEEPPPTGWSPPLGIPYPTFGIDELHTDYVGATYDFGDGPVPYPTTSNGPYTHYIDNTHPSSTDTNNPYGTPTMPRKTLPHTAAAGSILEVHGGPYTYTNGTYVLLRGSGTATQPVFIRGVSTTTKPRFTHRCQVYGSYIIIENLSLAGCDIIYSGVGAVSNVAVRACEISDTTGGNAMKIASYTGDTTRNVLVYNCNIHNSGGAVDPSIDRDWGGIAVEHYAKYIWLLDNTVSYNNGTGIQIVAGTKVNADIQFVYVGRNTVHHCTQSGIWCKNAQDVIFSQNTCYSIYDTAWSPSKGMGTQYGPERLWIINNRVYDCVYGIRGASGGNQGLPVYIMGNVIYRCGRLSDSDSDYQPNGWTTAAINCVGAHTYNIYNNTIYDSDCGISQTSTGYYNVYNNVFSQIRAGTNCYHIYFETTINPHNVKNCSFYQSDSIGLKIKWGSSLYTSIAAFLDAKAKGQDCIETNPLLNSPATGDMTIASTSPCIDAGLADVDAAYATFYNTYGINIRKDINGVTRPANGVWDIGASEYGQSY